MGVRGSEIEKAINPSCFDNHFLLLVQSIDRKAVMRSFALWAIVALISSYSVAVWADPNDCFGDRKNYEACQKRSSATRRTDCLPFKKSYEMCLEKVERQNHKKAAKVTLPPGTTVERNLTGNSKSRYREETSKGSDKPRHFTGEMHRKAEAARKGTGLVDRPDCRYTIKAGKKGINAREADVAGGPKRSKVYLIEQSDIRKNSPSDCVPYKH